MKKAAKKELVEQEAFLSFLESINHEILAEPPTHFIELSEDENEAIMDTVDFFVE
jgi:hypothetical protein